MSTYQIGERVWALSGADWWPAKVVMGSVYGIAHAQSETVVQYYAAAGAEGGEFDVLLPEQLTPYEESSEKAATLDATLLAAMEAAKGDSEALPLRDAPSVGSKRPREDGGAATRHQRKEKNRHHEETSSDAGAAAPSPKADTSSSAKAVTIIRIQTELLRATAAGDVITTRRCLLKLANERMSYPILRETKIGVSVANLLGLEAFKPLHPLVKAIVSDWAGKLPDKTIEAIKHELDVSTLS
eukprot:GILI01015454.1.p1 GENE.GILI01015454.1~~GILI01015454.1.p1  ORF type:complete len:242 (-),score=68.52 GILI01015454.1:304-1029(-)